MYTFKTKPDGFRQIKRTIMFRDFPLILLTISSVMFVMAFGKTEKPIDWYLLATAFLILSVIIAFSFLQIMIHRRHIYEDFLLTIDEDWITREQYHTDTLTVAKDEVSKIYKTSNGGLVIQGSPGSDPIFIPPQMEESDKLERLLSDIKPFSEAPFLEKYKYLTILTVISLFAAFNLVTNKWFAGISGAVLLGFQAYLLYKRYRHKNIADISKVSIFLSLYLVFIIVRKIFSTVSGG